MRIMSRHVGEVTAQKNQTLVHVPTNKGHIASYNVTAHYGLYSLVHIATTETNAFFFDATAKQNDNLKIISHTSTIYLIVSLRNSFELNFQLPNVEKILLHQNSIILFHANDLYFEFPLAKENTYSLFVLSFPVNWIFSPPNKKPRANKFLKAIENNKPEKLSTYMAILNLTLINTIYTLALTDEKNRNEYIKKLITDIAEIIFSDKSKNLKPVTKKMARKIYEVTEFIEKNIFRKDLSLNVIVAETGINKFIIKVYFPKIHTMTVHDYINNKRIELATFYLENPKTKINTIASTVGFNNTISFNRVFKQLTGITPTQYRNKYNTKQKS